jgi:hypothetical protein
MLQYFFNPLGDFMNVLKPGVEGGLWKEEVLCTGGGNGNDGCGATLEVQAGDLFHTASTDMTGSTDDFITIECVLCKKWTDSLWCSSQCSTTT